MSTISKTQALKTVQRAKIQDTVHHIHIKCFTLWEVPIELDDLPILLCLLYDTKFTVAWNSQSVASRRQMFFLEEPGLLISKGPYR